MENLEEREADCDGQLNQVLEWRVHRQMIMRLGVLAGELEVRWMCQGYVDELCVSEVGECWRMLLWMKPLVVGSKMMCWHSAGHVLNKTNTGARCCVNAHKCCDQVSDGQHVHQLHKWEIGYEMKWGELWWCLQSQKLRMSMRARTQMRTQTKRSRNEGENFLYSIFVVYRLYETISQRLKAKKKEKCAELNEKAWKRNAK